eukprot:m.168570 g.168570  ORF g.168570 m.168570 type:complete len:520 (+) comp31529_c0_seq1:266-1825(+)
MVATMAEGNQLGLRVNDIRVKLAAVQLLSQLEIVLPKNHNNPKFHNGKKKFKEKSATQQFGVPLTDLVQRTGVTYGARLLKVPKVLADIIEKLGPELSAEGTFRISGNAMRLKEVYKELDAGKNVKDTIHEVHDLTGTLKALLRQLPIPLLTCELYQPFIDAVKLTDQRSRLLALQLLVLCLPKEHIDTFALLSALWNLTAITNGNKMSASTLASIISPNILRPLPTNKKRPRDVQQAIAGELMNHGATCKIVEIFILNHSAIGVIPARAKKLAGTFTVLEATKMYKLVTRTGNTWWRPWRRDGAQMIQKIYRRQTDRRKGEIKYDEESSVVMRKKSGGRAFGRYGQRGSNDSVEEVFRRAVSEGAERQTKELDFLNPHPDTVKLDFPPTVTEDIAEAANVDVPLPNRVDTDDNANDAKNASASANTNNTDVDDQPAPLSESFSGFESPAGSRPISTDFGFGDEPGFEMENESLEEPSKPLRSQGSETSIASGLTEVTATKMSDQCTHLPVEIDGFMMY